MNNRMSQKSMIKQNENKILVKVLGKGKDRMTKEEIKELFMQGIDCSQVVAGRFADELRWRKAFLQEEVCLFWRWNAVW